MSNDRFRADQPLVVLTTTFSLNMLPTGFVEGNIRYKRIPESEVVEILANTSALTFGAFREELVQIIENKFGVTIGKNRRNVTFDHDTRVIAALYSGPKLLCGDTLLPPNGSINYFELVHSDVVEDEFERPRAYWGNENSDWPLADWKSDVMMDETKMGYWEWVRSNEAAERLNLLSEEK